MISKNTINFKKNVNNKKNNDILIHKLIKNIKIPYPLKYYYNNIIPLNIYQTWHTKNLPPMMKQTTEYIKKSNPKFNYYLYDDEDCYNFIKNNFDKNVLNAYNSLIPGAYKADLWRYCVLYINGGIYLDIKYKPLNNFKFINLTESEHFVLDHDNEGIYNALLVCLPRNNLLLKAINQIVINVKNKYYGNSPLKPTGPLLLSSLINKNEINLDLKHFFYKNINNRFILFNSYIIFKSYNNYLIEHDMNKKQLHYGNLWNQKKIYH
jgi:mannosyltransferase OCH1-like enzyme